MKRKPISVEVKDEAHGRFVILTYANSDAVRERVDPKKKPTRRPRRPPTKLGLEALDKTRRKRIRPRYKQALLAQLENVRTIVAAEKPTKFKFKRPKVQVLTILDSQKKEVGSVRIEPGEIA